MRRQQRTISQPVCLAGIGYWSSRDVTVEFRPAAPDTGITFVRGELTPVRRIPARVEHRIVTPRRTTLAKGPASVEMVEHILAALAGYHIDNCEVWVNAAEMPALDGSSQAALAALMRAGAIEQKAERDTYVVDRRVRVGSQDAWLLVEPSTRPGLTLCYELDFGPKSPIRRQRLEVELSPAVFAEGIASARTFILEHDAERMTSNGLGERITYQDLLVFGEHGPIDNQLRFADECVRHKILDMVGDLSLLEADIRGRVSAYRSGHHLNAELVRQLRKLRAAELTRKSA